MTPAALAAFWLGKIEAMDVGTTHWDGCEQEHLRCAFVKVAKALEASERARALLSKGERL